MLIKVKDIRAEVFSRRAALSEPAQKGAAAQLFRRVDESGLLDEHQHIAFYWPSRGEISPTLLLEHAIRLGKDCYLPVLERSGDNWLHFAPYHSCSELQNNRYGIPEPLHALEQLRPAEHLDLVFVPLVTFDDSGNRIGMGKGFYDRTFAFLRAPRAQPGPLLVGLAHQFQHIAQLRPQPWDVPLAMAYTEQQLYDFRRR